VSGQLQAPAALPLGKSLPPYPLDRRLGGPQNRSGWHGEEKILDPTRTQTPIPLSSSPYPAALPTVLSRLLAKIMMDIPIEYHRPLHKHIFLHGLTESRNLTLRFCYMLRMIHFTDGTGWPDFESEEKTCKFKLQGSSMMYQLVSLILHALSFLSLAEMIQKDIKHWRHIQDTKQGHKLALVTIWKYALRFKRTGRRTCYFPYQYHNIQEQNLYRWIVDENLSYIQKQ
jgi:hypothetical protein